MHKHSFFIGTHHFDSCFPEQIFLNVQIYESVSLSHYPISVEVATCNFLVSETSQYGRGCILIGAFYPSILSLNVSSATKWYAAILGVLVCVY